MQLFEIHITGDESIIKHLDELYIKNISVELLKPNGDVLRTEHMSSFVEKHETQWTCLERVQVLVKELTERGVNIIRTKVETPYDENLAPYSIYMESHFKTTDNKYPMSRNVKSGKIMGTDRTYKQFEYNEFRNKWENEEVELCIYDSFSDEDKDWLTLYKN